MDLLLGSGNAKKRDELARLLEDLPIRVLTLKDLDPRPPEPAEDGATFAENARKKALGYARASGSLTLADDSGLEVEALDGAPGVRSARFAGEDADDAGNLALLLERLEGVPAARRGARFVCALALAAPDGRILYEGVGSCSGRLLETPRGTGGFGYDPIFRPEGAARTFAEMRPEEKAELSHRGRALAAFRAALPGLLEEREAR